MQETKQVAAQAQTDPAEEFRDFAYIVSHDLAGPVRTILGFSQLLSEDAKKMASEEDRLHLELIQESSQKLNEMIQGLLAFSRLNTVPRAPEMVDLEITLARCHMELQPLIDVTKAQLSYPRMPELVADPRRMFSLFFYLVENSIKFHKPGVAPDIRIFVDERPNVIGFHERVADLHVTIGGGQPYLDLVVYIFLYDQPARGGTALPSSACRRREIVFARLTTPLGVSRKRASSCRSTPLAFVLNSPALA